VTGADHPEHGRDRQQDDQPAEDELPGVRHPLADEGGDERGGQEHHQPAQEIPGLGVLLENRERHPRGQLALDVLLERLAGSRRQHGGSEREHRERRERCGDAIEEPGPDRDRERHKAQDRHEHHRHVQQQRVGRKPEGRVDLDEPQQQRQHRRDGDDPGRHHQLQPRRSGHTIFSTRVNAFRSSRSGVSQAV
jgi:hypothetical protein